MGRMIRVLLALGALLFGASLMISGGMCVVTGVMGLPPVFALIGLGGLLLGYFIARAAYLWGIREPESAPHDS